MERVNEKKKRKKNSLVNEMIQYIINVRLKKYDYFKETNLKP